MKPNEPEGEEQQEEEEVGRRQRAAVGGSRRRSVWQPARRIVGRLADLHSHVPLCPAAPALTAG